MNTISSVLLILFVYSFSLILSSPTTPHIYEVFTGKCYQRNPTNTNCSLLWNDFAQGAMMDMGMANIGDFDGFFSLSNFSSPMDQALFWSGNMDFANILSAGGDKFTMMEETSTGSVINGLSWCGLPYANNTPPAFDYTNNCDYLQNQTYFGMQGVWMKCSQLFAQGASGVVNVLLQPRQLNSTFGPWLAFRDNSIFSSVELPAMYVNQVTAIRILLLANLTQAPSEKCGKGSLLTLSQRIYQKFNFYPSCVDDPEELLAILCNGDNQQKSPECLMALFAATSANSGDQAIFFNWAVSTTVISVVFVGVVMGLLLFLYKTRMQSNQTTTYINYGDMRSPLLNKENLGDEEDADGSREL